MKEFAEWALETALGRGATYVEVRVTDIRQRYLSTKNAQPAQVRESESLGLGVRVIADGAWGFAATDDLTRKGTERVAADAVEVARASAICKKDEVRLAPEERTVDRWEGPCRIDPFAVPVSSCLDLMLKVDAEMLRVKGVTLTEALMDFRRIEQLFLSSLGSEIYQKKIQTGAGFAATSFDGNEIQKRSYPNSFGGQYQTKGYELVEELDLLANAARIAEEAVALHKADQCPSGEKDIILGGSQLGLQIHESIGHPIELDRVLGTEANYAGMSFLTVSELNPGALADRATRKALESRGPREIEPGKYTVILEPAAVLDLLGFLFFDFGGLAVLEKRSCLTDRLGKKIFGENINVHDDVYHPLQSGAEFDGEGIPRQRVTLIEKGVVRNVVYARATAHKAGVEPTGHGFPLPNEYGEIPLNIVMEGNGTPSEEMIRSTDRGLLVTRLWYIREVDPYQKLLTGMTRDGTFWIEGGEVRHGVKNLRFNQSVIEMLNHVEMLGQPQRTSGEESFDMVVPAMKVRDFNFSSLTKF